MNTSGMKTAAREIVIARIVKLISPADFSVASRAVCPSSISRTVFSRKTMASSTRNPIANVSAISDRLSRLYPSTCIAMNVSSSDSGSAIAGINVSVARPRKMKMMNTTSANAMMSVSFTSRTLLTIVWDRSYAGTIRNELGSSAWMLGRRPRTA